MENFDSNFRNKKNYQQPNQLTQNIHSRNKKLNIAYNLDKTSNQDKIISNTYNPEILNLIEETESWGLQDKLVLLRKRSGSPTNNKDLILHSNKVNLFITNEEKSNLFNLFSKNADYDNFMKFGYFISKDDDNLNYSSVKKVDRNLKSNGNTITSNDGYYKNNTEDDFAIEDDISKNKYNLTYDDSQNKINGGKFNNLSNKIEVVYEDNNENYSSRTGKKLELKNNGLVHIEYNKEKTVFKKQTVKFSFKESKKQNAKPYPCKEPSNKKEKYSHYSHFINNTNPFIYNSKNYKADNSNNLTYTTININEESITKKTIDVDNSVINFNERSNSPFVTIDNITKNKVFTSNCIANIDKEKNLKMMFKKNSSRNYKDLGSTKIVENNSENELDKSLFLNKENIDNIKLDKTIQTISSNHNPMKISKKIINLTQPLYKELKDNFNIVNTHSHLKTFNTINDNMSNSINSYKQVEHIDTVTSLSKFFI